MAALLPAYVLFGVLKHLFPLQRLAKWAWRSPAGHRDREAERRLIACVLRLSQLSGPRDDDCLQRSLLLYRVLSRAGAEPTLVVGFCRTNGQVLGHAWVIVDGEAVIESKDDLVQFSPTISFGARGEFLPIPPDPCRT